MKRKTAQQMSEKDQRISNLERQNGLLLMFLRDTALSMIPPDAHTVNGQYGAQLYRALDGNGGYVLIKDFGSANIHIHYLDDINDRWPIEIRILADRLRVQRQVLLDEEKEREKESLQNA